MQARSENGHFKQTERFKRAVYLQNVGQQSEWYWTILNNKVNMAT